MGLMRWADWTEVCAVDTARTFVTVHSAVWSR